jgi:hypothetical protein
VVVVVDNAEPAVHNGPRSPHNHYPQEDSLDTRQFPLLEKIQLYALVF